MLSRNFAQFVLLLLFPLPSQSGFNGMARTPPMGWRSWNQYSWQIDETVVLNALDGLIDTTRPIVGLPSGSSLKDMGYAEVGIDEGWASCGWPHGFPHGGWAYHRTDPTTGQVLPVINTTLFPSLASLNSQLHASGLRSGFYLNDCLSYCFELGDNCTDEICSPGDVQVWEEMDFDSLKTDGCSAQHNTTLWGMLLNQTKKSSIFILENCGNSAPPSPGMVNTSVPYHLYRISTDIRNSFGSWMQNAQYVQHYAENSLHGPGLWAYPDMLMIGVTTDINGPLIPPTLTEQRTHFGLWCILSSPLTLSMDFTNTTNTDKVWSIISNIMAVQGVNQAWAGSPGGRFAQATVNVTIQHCTPTWDGDRNCSLPVWQAYYKPLPSTVPSVARFALFLVNLDNQPLDLSLPLSLIPSLPCGGGPGECIFAVTDVWMQQPDGQIGGTWDVTGLPSHDSAFVILEKQR